MNIAYARQFFESIPKYPKFSILLRANHAVGKSEFVKDFGKSKGMKVIDIRLGQREVGDIIGMPSIEEKDGKKVFRHILPELLSAAFNEPCVLFFDELNRGTKDVQQAVFEVILDRRMNGQELHPETIVVAAINHNLDIYTVTEMDPALLSRFCVIDFEPTVSEWLSWGKNRLHPAIIEFVKINKDQADPGPKTDLSNPHPNRRSWTMFSDFLYTINIETVPDLFIREMCASFVGRSSAELFVTILKNFQNISAARDVKVNQETITRSSILDDLINKKKETKDITLPDDPIAQSLILTEYANFINRKPRLHGSVIIRVIPWINTLNREVLIDFWKKLMPIHQERLSSYSTVIRYWRRGNG